MSFQIPEATSLNIVDSFPQHLAVANSSLAMGSISCPIPLSMVGFCLKTFTLCPSQEKESLLTLYWIQTLVGGTISYLRDLETVCFWELLLLNFLANPEPNPQKNRNLRTIIGYWLLKYTGESLASFLYISKCLPYPEWHMLLSFIILSATSELAATKPLLSGRKQMFRGIYIIQRSSWNFPEPEFRLQSL